jgi:SnoaL-like domain
MPMPVGSGQPMKSDPFRQAVESKDLSKLEEVFSPEVVFRSPAVFKPYSGLDAVRALLGTVAEVLEDFRYADQVETGDTAVLVFEARVGDRQLDGVDILRFDADGRIAELMVMIRPLSGLNAVAEEMGRRLGVTTA